MEWLGGNEFLDSDEDFMLDTHPDARTCESLVLSGHSFDAIEGVSHIDPVTGEAVSVRTCKAKFMCSNAHLCISGIMPYAANPNESHRYYAIA